jgi:sensor c-di-GMP phosphodiesterase-like protein
MMRTLKQRILITLTATLMAAACGVMAGYLLGRAITIRLSESKLQQSAARTISEADASSLESRNLLATMNASPYPYCSEAEIAYFRNLIFASEFLHEAGRIRDGKIECSATLGRLPQPLAEGSPDFSQSDGTRVYKKFPPFKVGNLLVLSLQLGDSYVIFSPYIETHRAAPPIRYISTSVNELSAEAGLPIDGMPGASRAILATNGQGRVGNSMYATRCSARYFNCVTEYVAIPDALRADRTHLFAYILMGGLSGACFGLVFSFLSRRSRSMERQLRRAVATDKLHLVYQPIVNLATRQIVGAEALARWRDEEDSPVPPDVFIKIAEEQGFVGEITRLVVRHAMRDFGPMLRSHPDFQLSINVAASDLSDPGFLLMLDRALEKASVQAHSLAIEITESCTAVHQIARQTILGLRRRGHSVHIDDFGTGYSSLSYLHSLSIDAIKIDKSFTHAIGTQAVTVSILPQILAMAETLKLRVIVEGIETELQANFLGGINRSILAQGWLFGRPVPAGEFHRLLAEEEEQTFVPMDV